MTRKTAQTGYEKRDIGVRTVFITAGVSIVLLILFFVWSWDYFKTTKERITYENVLKPESPVLKEVRQREEKLLHTYGVIDAEQGKYHIPIEQAMELLAKEQARPKTNTVEYN